MDMYARPRWRRPREIQPHEAPRREAQSPKSPVKHAATLPDDYEPPFDDIRRYPLLLKDTQEYGAKVVVIATIPQQHVVICAGEDRGIPKGLVASIEVEASRYWQEAGVGPDSKLTVIRLASSVAIVPKAFVRLAHS